MFTRTDAKRVQPESLRFLRRMEFSVDTRLGTDHELCRKRQISNSTLLSHERIMTSRRSNRLFLAIVCIAAFVLAPRLSWAAIGEDEFLRSPGATAFKDKKYNAALLGFEALLQDYPDDVLVLRYLGITYDQLGRYEDAIATFGKAMKLAPKRPALHYFLGVTYFKMRKDDRAVRNFNTCIALALDSIYAQRAKRVLEIIERQKAEYKTPGPPRAWKLYAQVGVQHDDNVLLAPDVENPPSGFVPPDAGFSFVEYLSGSYIVLRHENWRLKAEFSTYQSQHFESDLHDLDLSTFEPAVELSYATAVWDRPLSAVVHYAYNVALLDGDRFSRSHEVTTSLRVRPYEHALTTPFFRISFDEFDNDGVLPSFTSRDATNKSYGIKQYLFFNGDRDYLSAGYEAQFNTADGNIFGFDGHKFILSASVGLPWLLRLDLGAEYAEEDYNFKTVEGGSPVGPDRQSKRQVYSAALSRKLSRELLDKLAVSLSYSYTREDSNFALLEYERHVVTLVMAYTFGGGS